MIAGAPGPENDTGRRLEFFRKLQAVTTKIHATGNLDEIMLHLGMEFCDLFDCDRFTLYVTTPEKDHIVSKVKTGLTSFRDVRLSISPSSIAGFVAQTRRTVNITDVYDEAELGQLSPQLRFQGGVDQRTGYRTREMLAAPLVGADTPELLGVVQFINNRSKGPFSDICIEGVHKLAETLSVALSKRLQPAPAVNGKYDGLVADGVMSASDLGLATRGARTREIALEEILVNEYHVKPAAIGAALSRYFKVPYEPYRADRIKPVDLLRNLKVQYIEENHWLPLEDGKDGMVVLATDPERINDSRIVSQIFPKAKVVFRVTTELEFSKTVAQFVGSGATAEGDSVGELLSGLESDDEDSEAPQEVSEAVENELVRLVNKVIIDAYRQGVSDIHIEPLPGKGKTGIRFRKDGTLVPYIEIPASYRSALVARVKIM